MSPAPRPDARQAARSPVGAASRSLRRALPLLVCALAACGGGDGGTTGPERPPTAAQEGVAGIDVTGPATSLPVGSTVQLAATVRGTRGTVLQGRRLTWTTSAPTIAAVDSTGLVRGLAAGSATIAAGADGQTGTMALTVVAPARLATVVTLPATDVTGSSVIVGGTVNPNGTLTSWEIQVGATAALGERCTASREPIGGTDAVPVRCQITGQPAGRTIFYRVVATNAAGTQTGQTLSVTLVAGDVVVTTLPAQAVTSTSVQLPGSVQPAGRTLQWTIEYGRTSALGTRCPGALTATGTTLSEGHCPLVGQTPGATIFYRAVATETSTARSWTGAILSVQLPGGATGGDAASADRFVYHAVRLGGSGIWLGSVDGVAARFVPVPEATGVVITPSWSPDRRSVVYARGNVAGARIWTASLDGSNARQLTARAGLAPAWSPDGRFIAYADAAADVGIAIVNADLTTPRAVPTPGDADHPHWAPNGTDLTFIVTTQRDGGANSNDAYDLYTVRLDGANLRRLGSFRGDSPWPRWSPDGTRIAIPHNVNGQAEIVLVDVVSGATTTLTGGVGRKRFPSWSPDGRRLMYLLQPPGASAANQVWIVNADGTGARRITGLAESVGGNELSVLWPSWSR